MKSGNEVVARAFKRKMLKLTCLSAALMLGSSSSLAATDKWLDLPPAKIKLHSPLVTGNGFGYTVVATTGDVTRLYAHPYRYEKANPDPSKDGFTTPNFVKKLSWKGQAPASKPEQIGYINESNVIRVKSSQSQNEYDYFSPFQLKHNVLIAVNRKGDNDNSDAVLNAVWLHPVQTDELLKVQNRNLRLLKFKDVKELLAIVPLDEAKATSLKAKNNAIDGGATAFVVLEKKEDLQKSVGDLLKWQAKLSGSQLIEREIKDLESWRVKPNVTFKSDAEKTLWRQNETIFKMAQILEENNPKRVNHGLILACLPDGVWFTPWVRDMSYALVGLSRMGHLKEARLGIISWMNAHPMALWKKETRNQDYQISVVRYYGDGSEEADYSGLSTPNVEFDDWGLALWAIGEYWNASHDKSLLKEKTYRGNTVYESMRDFIVKPLLVNTDPYKDGIIVQKDSSCWEEHQEHKRHYSFSTITAIPGLQAFEKIAREMKDEKTANMVSEKIKALQKGFRAAFVADGAVRGLLEVKEQPKTKVDGSSLEAVNFGVLDVKDSRDLKIIDKTIENMSVIKTASGGYKRNTGPSNYEAHEFLFVDFALVRALQKMGRKEEAAKMFDWLVEKSVLDHGLVAEMYVSETKRDCPGEVGDPAGAIPMVGYGAGLYVMTLAERESQK